METWSTQMLLEKLVPTDVSDSGLHKPSIYYKDIMSAMHNKVKRKKTSDMCSYKATDKVSEKLQRIARYLGLVQELVSRAGSEGAKRIPKSEEPLKLPERSCELSWMCRVSPWIPSSEKARVIKSLTSLSSRHDFLLMSPISQVQSEIRKQVLCFSLYPWTLRGRKQIDLGGERIWKGNQKKSNIFTRKCELASSKEQWISILYAVIYISGGIHMLLI